MIIRPLGASELLITQPDHAALAARILGAWEEDALRRSPRRREILLAVGEHDNGWQEVDAAPLLDPATGRMLDFTEAPADVRQAVWPRGVERLSAASSYAAALVAQHAIHIYGRWRDDDGWQSFFAVMQEARNRELHRARQSLEDLLADYQFVRIGDLISLAFCNGWTDVEDDGFGRTVRFDRSRVAVTPNPFGGNAVPIEVTGREMPAGRFASDAEARRAFAAAPSKTLHGVVS